MSSAAREMRICKDAVAMASQTAAAFSRLARTSVAEQGRFTVALAGGNTPRAAYMLLASDSYCTRLPWEQIHVFWGDKRHVPSDHADSNYRMAHEAMLSTVGLPTTNVHRMRAEQEAQQAADEYEATLRTFVGLGAGAVPRFDLLLLGMGPDGHPASLFPGTAAVREQPRLVVAPWVEQFQPYRLTMTPPVSCPRPHEAREETRGRGTETWSHGISVSGEPTGVEMAGVLSELARCALAHGFRAINPQETRMVLMERSDPILSTVSNI
jgi:6-phosphogluconolactonase